MLGDCFNAVAVATLVTVGWICSQRVVGQDVTVFHQAIAGIYSYTSREFQSTRCNTAKTRKDSMDSMSWCVFFATNSGASWGYCQLLACPTTKELLRFVQDGHPHSRQTEGKSFN